MPGEPGIWFFISGDLLVFSLFFATILFYRGQNPGLFAESQAQLNQAYGLINTLLMLTSSWGVASAVRAARHGRAGAAYGFLLAFVCGAAFAVIKVLEYREKILAGITLNSNDFYMLFFMFTGIHFLHVLIGMGVLLYLWWTCRSRLAASTTMRNLESGASFWHVVDVLWIVLFALLYLVR